MKRTRSCALLLTAGLALPIVAQEAPGAQEPYDRVAAIAKRVADDYREGLTAYRAGNFAEAERRFRAVAERNRREPSMIKSQYFLARSLMKQQRWEEASSILIGIHRLWPAFYREWGCDFLLGECRRGQGLD